MAEIFYCIKNICKNFKINCFNSLKNISADNNDINKEKIYLCQCQSQRLDFDFFVKKYFNHPIPSSVDTILFYEKNKKLYLIEFKNQKCSDIDNNEIKKKIFDSINVLKEISKRCNVKFDEYTLYVGIVYNDKPKWRRRICSNTIQFGLEYFKEQNMIKDVKTNDIEWFKKKYLSIKDKVI